MDWLARYAEFVTPDQISNVVMAFKDLYSGPDAQLRDSFINHKHNSEAIPTVVQMLRNLRSKRNTIAFTVNNNEETFDQNMSILLSILEPLLINDQNLETFFKLQVVPDLCQLLYEQPLPSENAMSGAKVFRQHFKYAIRCITSCLRNELGVQERVLRILEEFQEEEIVANSSKILRLILRDDVFYDPNQIIAQKYDRVVMAYSQIGNFLLQLMNQHFYSAAVIQETTAAFRNYTRKPNYLNTINSVDLLKVLVNVVRDPKFDKQKFVTLQAIKNLIRSAEHERYFKQIGANDVIVMANMSNQVGQSLGNAIVGNSLARRQ